MRIKLLHKGKKHKRMPLRQLQIHHMTHSSLHTIDLYIELDLFLGEAMFFLLGYMRTVLEGIMFLVFLGNDLGMVPVLERRAPMVMVVGG